MARGHGRCVEADALADTEFALKFDDTLDLWGEWEEWLETHPYEEADIEIKEASDSLNRMLLPRGE